MLRTDAAKRKTVGAFFSRMMHFAFTGKYDVGTDKPATQFTKVKVHAMNALYEAILKQVLPSFSSIESDESLVEKLQKFLAASPTSTAGKAAASASAEASSSKTANTKVSGEGEGILNPRFLFQGDIKHDIMVSIAAYRITCHISSKSHQCHISLSLPGCVSFVHH